MQEVSSHLRGRDEGGDEGGDVRKRSEGEEKGVVHATVHATVHAHSVSYIVRRQISGLRSLRSQVKAFIYIVPHTECGEYS